MIPVKRLAFSVLLLASIALFAFNNTIKKQTGLNDIFQKANRYNRLFNSEKVYLHLDRSSYWSGEDIWFKAYLVNTILPECNLYVELINAAGDVVDKKICWVQNGLSYGDFHLPNTIQGGIYQVRAYTNWMRNRDDAGFFRKNILIWNLRDKALKAFTEEIKPKDTDLQFFPEGGTFVAGLENKLAFKATDKNGRGIQVKGEITDDKGNYITSFRSSFKGMGNLSFIPQAGKTYVANATIAGNLKLRKELPFAVEKGIKLSVKDGSDKIFINVSKNYVLSPESAENLFFIVGQAGGAVCYQKQVVIDGLNFSEEIEKVNLPGGIIKFTLFSNAMLPVCERLVFVKKDDFINIEIETTKLSYLPREKVQLKIKSLDKNNNPQIANLSVSVFNPQYQTLLEEYPGNILTHFLLSSELKGTIEDPAWYFKDDHPYTLEALDNVMLTHGYRYFEWNEISNDELPPIYYRPQNGIQLEGRITNWLTGKPVKNCPVTMAFVKGQLAVHEQVTDSEGKFLFDHLFFNDTIYASVQAGKNKNRKNNWIEIFNHSQVSPETRPLIFNTTYTEEEAENTSRYLSSLDAGLVNKKWSLNDTILLGDVNILANERKKQGIHLKPYLDADYIFNVEKYENIYVDIMEMLETNSAYMRSFLDKNPQYFLDGVLVDSDFVTGMPAGWFETVEAVKQAPGRMGIVPGIFFYTKRGENQRKNNDGIGTKSARIIGFSVIRKFYSPVYETAAQKESKNDLRSTIYWEPVVQTDSTGVATVSFYNSDETGDMQVVVEGISAKGTLCHGMRTYTVKY